MQYCLGTLWHPSGLITTADIATFGLAGLCAREPHDSVPQALAMAAERHGVCPKLTWLTQSGPAVPGQTGGHARLLHLARQTASVLNALGVSDELAVTLLLPANRAAYLALLGDETAGRVCPIDDLLDTEHIGGLRRAARVRVLDALAPCAESWTSRAKASQLRPL